MPSTMDADTCRLCAQPLTRGESNHRLCPICDEYVQHLALQTNRSFDDVVSEVRNAKPFTQALKRAH